VKLRIGKRAQRQIDKLEQWWREHLGSSKRFVDELGATFELIAAIPGTGVHWPTARRPALRRILMPETQNHVYFNVDEDKQMVFVLSVWGTQRGRTPKL
jgi:plasmid stabilization system protein ParE